MLYCHNVVTLLQYIRKCYNCSILLSITKRSSKLVLDMEIKFIVPIHEYKGHCVVCTDKANMMDVYTVRNMMDVYTVKNMMDVYTVRNMMDVYTVRNSLSYTTSTLLQIKQTIKTKSV